MSISNKVKETVWNNYTKNPSSKNELKSIFLSNKPGDAYNRIKQKISKQLAKETVKEKSNEKVKEKSKEKVKDKSKETVKKKPKEKSKEKVKK